MAHGLLGLCLGIKRFFISTFMLEMPSHESQHNSLIFALFLFMILDDDLE